MSVRLRGAAKFGTKAEVKNLNSFRFLKMALDYEILRQIALIESGGKVVQETRLYNVDSGETVSMRSKEHAHDYRYFPEPDLVPLRISDRWLARFEGRNAGIAAQKSARVSSRSSVCASTMRDVLTATRAHRRVFRDGGAAAGDPSNDCELGDGRLSAALKADGKDFADSPVTAEKLGELVALIGKGELTGKLAKEIFPKMYATGGAPRGIMESEGLKQISEAGALEKIVDEVLAANPKQVEQYKGGKTTVIGFLVGQVMKSSRGQANPATVNELLKNKLQ